MLDGHHPKHTNKRKFSRQLLHGLYTLLGIVFLVMPFFQYWALGNTVKYVQPRHLACITQLLLLTAASLHHRPHHPNTNIKRSLQQHPTLTCC